MAEIGETIVNPATGERIEFRTTRASSGGALLEFELTLAPYGRVGGVPHQHPAQETIEVVDGTLTARIGSERMHISPGERLVIPPGRRHYLYNETPHEIRAIVRAEPARDFETFFETVFELAQARRDRAFRGLPAPLHAALLSETYDVFAPVVPMALQRPVLRALAALGRKRGYPVRVPAERARADGVAA
ncbi:MAG: cupin domain-containing protein [Actinobacteria bacterium]|nr:MAG: cupin domain-containing protein [Actinomycetota bacterium]